MQDVKPTFSLKLFSSIFLALPLMLSLFSCSKNMDEMPVRDNQAASVSGQSAPAQVSIIEESIPYERTYYVPCANSGNGEEVELKGTIHIVDQLVRNENNFKLTYNINMQNVSGTGLTTGDSYRASGGGPGTLTGSFDNGQFTAYYIEAVRIVSQNSTYIVNYKFHVTITPDGTVTSYISEENIDCRN